MTMPSEVGVPSWADRPALAPGRSWPRQARLRTCARVLPTGVHVCVHVYASAPSLDESGFSAGHVPQDYSTSLLPCRTVTCSLPSVPGAPGADGPDLKNQTARDSSGGGPATVRGTSVNPAAAAESPSPDTASQACPHRAYPWQHACMWLTPAGGWQPQQARVHGLMTRWGGGYRLLPLPSGGSGDPVQAQHRERLTLRSRRRCSCHFMPWTPKPAACAQRMVCSQVRRIPRQPRLFRRAASRG